MDHSIAALSASRIVRISKSDIAALLERPAIARASAHGYAGANESIGRDWLANVGGRRAEATLGPSSVRMAPSVATGGPDECQTSVNFPLTQLQVGETLGMTSVHVNQIASEPSF